MHVHVREQAVNVHIHFEHKMYACMCTLVHVEFITHQLHVRVLLPINYMYNIIDIWVHVHIRGQRILGFDGSFDFPPETIVLVEYQQGVVQAATT